MELDGPTEPPNPEMSQVGCSLSVVVNSVSSHKGNTLAAPTYVPNTDWTISVVISEENVS
jgi:hypothetical protein